MEADRSEIVLNIYIYIYIYTHIYSVFGDFGQIA